MTWADNLWEQAGQPEVVRRARHALHVKGAGRSTIALCVGGPLHYRDGAEWRAIDPTLISLPSGRWGGLGVPVSLGADGAVYLDGTSYSHLTTRVGIFTPSSRSFSGVWSVPLGSRDGARFLAAGTFGGAPWQVERGLTEGGYHETLTLGSRPSVQAKSGDYLVLESLASGLSFPDGELGSFTVGDLASPLPVAYDAAGNLAPTKRYARTVGGQLYLYTGLPVSWLASAVYPVTLDPDFTADVSDGYIDGYNADYATARATSIEQISTTGSFIVGQQKNGVTYYVYRAYLAFDTSSITVGNTVTQSNLTLTWYSNASTTDFTIRVHKHNWVGTWGTAANREADYDGALASTYDADLASSAAFSSGAAVTSSNLDISWVNRTGVTRHALLSDRDVAATTPTTLEYVQFYSASAGTPSFRPALTVLYEGAPLATTRSFAVIVG